MNIPRQFHPADRPAVAAGLRPHVFAPGVTISARTGAGIVPSDSLDDACRRQCSTVRNDSGYNLCYQLCRSPHG